MLESLAGEERLRSSPARAGMLCSRRGRDLVSCARIVQQPAGDGGEVVRLAAHRQQARQQKAEGIVERVIHHPHARCTRWQGSKALGLLFELEQGGLVEGRASGEIAARHGFVEQVKQLLVVLGGQRGVGALWLGSPLSTYSSRGLIQADSLDGLP